MACLYVCFTHYKKVIGSYVDTADIIHGHVTCKQVIATLIQYLVYTLQHTEPAFSHYALVFHSFITISSSFQLENWISRINTYFKPLVLREAITLVNSKNKTWVEVLYCSWNLKKIQDTHFSCSCFPPYCYLKFEIRSCSL